ncbi:MAG: hypothetical protein AAF221_12145 [Pseudomonadota bacterium]
MASDKSPAENETPKDQPKAAPQDAVERAYEAEEKDKAAGPAKAKPANKTVPPVKQATKKAPAAKPAAEKTPEKKEAPKKAPPKNEPAKAADVTAAAPQDAKRSGGGKFAWLLVFLLLFFIGGVAATPYLLPQVRPFLPEQLSPYFAALDAGPGPAADLSEVTARLNQLDAGLKDVRQVAADARAVAAQVPEQGSVDTAGSDAAIADMSTRLDGLAAQLEQVASAQAQQADSYARLQDNLAALPADGEGGISPAALAAVRGQLDDLASTQTSAASAITLLEEKMSALLDTMNAPSEDVASAAALGDVADALRARLAGLEERINVVSDAASSAADPEALAGVQQTVTSEIDRFQARLNALENVRQQATAAMVAGLETARLTQAISNGRSYNAELKALQQLKAQAGPALPDIADLLDEITPYAATGIPSGAALAAQLEDRAREILTAIDTPQDATWWDRLLARLRNLITVRQVGAAAGGTAPSDVLARAETSARAGDWQAVVEEISALPNNAQASLGPWWGHAQARSKAQQVLADLNARLGVGALDAGQ